VSPYTVIWPGLVTLNCHMARTFHLKQSYGQDLSP